MLHTLPIKDDTNIQQDQTPYEDRELQLSVQFPEAYPFDAPKVAFTSRVYHLNVDAKGEVHLDTLQDKWAPNMNMHESLLSIYKLLIEPNPDFPADPEVSRLWKSDREAYNRKAMDTVQ
ncbi:E2 ubiquitin-conjugating protein [Penicillium cinerascens]|uniref:E2 ubiquitin-conjugating protein n=1 Tax=Penicillium cinerascens TaxID=70096 RepID=A0A9W9MNJ7_9EURO|nr:E2 ubiquitin-conjugating protein [Penicillium cinerascens]KAJ5204538.1 E2 ubiquitin-conjugating protein [Penicillium cinerascens]